ncbi:MAG: isoleucine--tRNA ligase [Bradyrhizobiaceae bacterium]|nr:isoleucine--tRNA ligase [Bradyrhizobiaceae bacterium]
MSADQKPAEAADYSKTLFLPQTDFPMRAGLPQKEPELLARWNKLGLYQRLREASKGRARFILHDGPPYANGNIHIGHALNKILKDMVTRTYQMMGWDSNYVPGWDCHGLPIEWKIEEQYRAKGKDKDAVPIVEFRKECRQFAEHWIGVQREEFKRLGVEGDWAKPYTTMSFDAEAAIARELMKFAANGTLYRGSKPVMWSVVEKTALAEAEVEYEDYTSDTVWVKFPIIGRWKDGKVLPVGDRLKNTSVVIWTTTPWTIPGNRAISFSPKVFYSQFEVTEAPADNWAKVGDRFVVAGKLADEVKKAARISEWKNVGGDVIEGFEGLICAHPLANTNDYYSFPVPLLAGDHVTDEDGTGFVHTAPGHGRDDFDIWTANTRELQARGIDTTIPYTVDASGFFTKDAPGFEGKRVIDDKGNKGDANEAVIKALINAGMLIARGRLKHQYPHSWRSKKPVIFRNTPQWFIAMDKDIAGKGDTLRKRALDGIKTVKWVPPQGENRITGMIENRPDWVISRQRAWGVPITVFVSKKSGEILLDEQVNQRISDAFEQEGADAWFADKDGARFLAPDYSPADFEKVNDILDVWFDSGSTHAFVLEDPKNFPALANIRRKHDGGDEAVMYLEGSDQHRGWFHSSLLESCGTRGVPPFDVVLTHGFTLDENGRPMSKSVGNVVSPQDVIKQSGADILRLWVAAADYADDQRIGPEILKTTVDTYRKLRNTLRWLLGSLHHFDEQDRVPFEQMPELERLILHRLAELDADVRQNYCEFDYKRVFAALNAFMTSELSAFYFDIRKDALYCDPLSSVTRKACLTVLDRVFRCLVTWLAPIFAFTAEEVWLARYPSADGSVHLQTFPEVPAAWRDDALAEKWRKVRLVRRVVTGALEVERVAKRIGASLEAAPVIHIADASLRETIAGIDMAEVCITSGATVVAGEGPAGAFRLDDVAGVAVEPKRAEGKKCARSWKISPLVGSDKEYPDVTPRDAQALREFYAARRAAE